MSENAKTEPPKGKSKITIVVAIIAVLVVAVYMLANSGYLNFNVPSGRQAQSEGASGTDISGKVTEEADQPVVKPSSRTWIDTELEFSDTEVVEEYLDGGVWYTISFRFDNPVNFATYDHDACQRWKESGKFQTSRASTGESGYESEFNTRYVTEKGKDETYCFVFKPKDNIPTKGEFLVMETQRL